MFPKSLAAVSMIVGSVWLIQGLGVADTGSFMDGEVIWAIIGAALLVFGLGAMVLKRRRRPGS